MNETNVFKIETNVRKVGPGVKTHIVFTKKLQNSNITIIDISVCKAIHKYFYDKAVIE